MRERDVCTRRYGERQNERCPRKTKEGDSRHARARSICLAFLEEEEKEREEKKEEKCLSFNCSQRMREDSRHGAGKRRKRERNLETDDEGIDKVQKEKKRNSCKGRTPERRSSRGRTMR